MFTDMSDGVILWNISPGISLLFAMTHSGARPSSRISSLAAQKGSFQVSQCRSHKFLRRKANLAGPSMCLKDPTCHRKARHHAATVPLSFLVCPSTNSHVKPDDSSFAISLEHKVRLHIVSNDQEHPPELFLDTTAGHS